MDHASKERFQLVLVAITGLSGIEIPQQIVLEIAVLSRELIAHRFRCERNRDRLRYEIIDVQRSEL